MKHGSLFSGIGGFDLASQWMGWENVFQVEIDSYCQKVLKKNFPNTERYGDIKEFKGERGSVDILSGGFPCQPFSTAGKRKGESDDRYLWPEYLRIIREIQPTYVVGENVTGLVSMEDGKTLEGIFTDLEGEGYTVESFIIPACGVGAWHRRERIWIIGQRTGTMENARSRGFGKQDIRGKQPRRTEVIRTGENVSDTNINGLQRNQSKPQTSRNANGFNEATNRQDDSPKPELGNVVDGLPTGMVGYWDREPGTPRVSTGEKDRVNKLKGLGNAIVPQVALEIFKAIETLNNSK